MGAGKTSVGGALAALLGRRFVDLDQTIEELERASIDEIFSRSGQAAFRQTETAALKKTLAERKAPLVLAVGGGAFSQPANQALLGDAGAVTIYLQAPIEELWQRATKQENSVRPLLTDKSAFQTLFQTRLEAYQKASLTVDTSGKSIEEVAAKIQTSLGLWIPEGK